MMVHTCFRCNMSGISVSTNSIYRCNRCGETMHKASMSTRYNTLRSIDMMATRVNNLDWFTVSADMFDDSGSNWTTVDSSFTWD